MHSACRRQAGQGGRRTASPPLVSPGDAWLLRQVWLAGAAVLVFLAGSCASYRPMPITPEVVHARLEPPDMEVVRLDAASFEHPQVKAVPFDDRDGLSPDEAAILAVLLNPSLRTVRDDRGLAEAQLLQAGLLPNPELAASYEVPTGGSTSGTVNAFGLELGWDVGSLMGRSARMKEATAHLASVDLDIAWKEWQVAEAAKAAVYRLASLEGQVALAQQAADVLAEQVSALRKAAADGLKTAKDLSAARSAGARAGETLIALRRQVAEQRLELKRLLGLPSGAEVRLQQGFELPSRVEVPVAAELLAGLEQRRLDLIALRRGYDSQEAAVRAAVLDQFPRISVGPTVGRDIENVNTAGLSLNVELPVFNRSGGKIAIERATRQKLLDEYVSRLFEARSDTELVLARMRYLNEQIAAAQTAELDLKRLVEDYQAALDEGRVDALTYHAAWIELTRDRSEVIVLKGQLAEAVVALELAAGRYDIARPGEVAVVPPAPREEASP